MPNELIANTRKSFEENLKDNVCALCPAHIPGLRDMVAYHFGWDDEVLVPGKRLRPLFLILVYASLGGEPEEAFQAGSALEVLHNFTLIHDDIQDEGEVRHGHPALWTKVGVPLAINVGDYLAGLSQSLMGSLPDSFSIETQKRAMHEFQEASLGVIQGQQLDIEFEQADQIGVDEYISMIGLKTARLFSAAFRIAAILKGHEDEYKHKLGQIGTDLGLGFQIQDDYLGIWGITAETGKSTNTDLLTRKKTFPAVTALAHSESFRELWKRENDENLVDEMKAFFGRSAIREDTLNLARAYFINAQTNLNELLPVDNQFSQALLSLVTAMFSPILTDS